VSPRHPNYRRHRPAPMSPEQVAEAFAYYQTHSQQETARRFGVSQATVSSRFRRVYGPGALRDAATTRRMKRATGKAPAGSELRAA
jgi:DNA invertase Pin-like site-specific DNA recombinase